MAQSDMPPTHLRLLAVTGEDYNDLEVTTKEVSTCIYIMFVVLQLFVIELVFESLCYSTITHLLIFVKLSN